MMLKPQKALHLHLEEAKARPKHLGHIYSVMEKYDGWYMYIDCIDGKWCDIRSKTGRVLPSMVKYSKLFDTIDYPTKNIRIIFEAVIPDEDGPRGYMEFKDCNGRFNQTKETLQDVVLKVHDVVIQGKEHMAFSERYKVLQRLFSRWCTQTDGEWLQLADIIDSTGSVNRWFEIYNDIVADGGEGVILKRDAAGYDSNKRNFNLMKIKCDVTLDLEVVGVEEGEGKYAGTLGKLTVKSKDGILNSVSGMRDDQRDAWWDNPEQIIGKVVEIQAMKVLKNGSLREGRFKDVRHDKLVEDIDSLL